MEKNNAIKELEDFMREHNLVICREITDPESAQYYAEEYDTLTELHAEMLRWRKSEQERIRRHNER